MSSDLGRIYFFHLFSGAFFLLAPHATKKRFTSAILIVFLEIKFWVFWWWWWLWNETGVINSGNS